jgi:hypothetical protein
MIFTMELDEDPGVALEVITGRRRGSRVYALICLADAMRHGSYPAEWEPRR